MCGRFARTTRRGRLHHPVEQAIIRRYNGGDILAHDRFNSLEDAKKAAGPNGVAHGGVWLMTVEGQD